MERQRILKDYQCDCLSQRQLRNLSQVILYLFYLFHWLTLITGNFARKLYCDSSPKNMHLSDLCLLMLTGSVVHGTDRVYKPDLEAVNFAQAMHGRKLTGNLIKEMEVALEDDCGFECLGEEQCRSYNFAKKNKVCQLNNSDRFSSLVNFTSDENFIYAGIKVSENQLTLVSDSQTN